MIDPFTFTPYGGRVIFGAGSLAQLRAEVERLQVRRALVVSTAEQVDQAKVVEQLLGDYVAGLFPGAKMHTPVAVTDEALSMIAHSGADGIVAIGGGSTVGLSKAIALRTDLPQIVIPTTYAGSEVTSILGETRGGIKTTRRSLKVLPEVVLYDVNLTSSLPALLSVTSGLNAIAHAAEALYARDRNPIVTMMAEEGVRSFVDALPKIILEPANQDARSRAQLGAWLCGLCLGSVEMALHHKLCHTLGGAFDLPHAQTHSVILPHAMAYNLTAVPLAREQLARAVGHSDPALALYHIASRLGAPLSLRELGMQARDIDKAADLAAQNPYWNPRPIHRDDIKGILTRAWAGDPPVEEPYARI
jgi:alcohol dehydrogenase class IV